jgi:tetraacyldisaccharide 4'-kinase
MPAGLLRERPGALGRADLVLLSARNGAALPAGLDPARTLRWHRRSLGFFSREGRARPMPSRAFVVAGIAAPERLLADLSALGCSVVGQALFRDHHRFTAGELETAAQAARAAGADAVVTTEKDAVRLTWNVSVPALVVHRIEAVLEDEGRLLSVLLRVTGPA